MITEFESQEQEINYYRNYVRKVVRERSKGNGYYHYLTEINDLIELIEDKRDFYETRSIAYSSGNRPDLFVKIAREYFKKKHE